MHMCCLWFPWWSLELIETASKLLMISFMHPLTKHFSSPWTDNSHFQVFEQVFIYSICFGLVLQLEKRVCSHAQLWAQICRSTDLTLHARMVRSCDLFYFLNLFFQWGKEELTNQLGQLLLAITMFTEWNPTLDIFVLIQFLGLN